MTIHLRMQWPSPAVGLPAFARHLVTLATEIHFLEIGLDAGPAGRFEAAKDLLGSVRRALEDAMETDDAAALDEIAARLAALLHALDDAGLSLTATVDQQAVEAADGVTHIDVLGIVAEPRAPSAQPAAAPDRTLATAH
jgi:hypothetical protein